MPHKKNKGKGKRGNKGGKAREVVFKEPEEEIPQPEPWHPAEAPPPDYELLSVTPSMEIVKTNMDIVLDHLNQDEHVKNYSSEFLRLYESTAVAHKSKKECCQNVDRQHEKIEEQEKIVHELTKTVVQQKNEINLKDDAYGELITETSYRRAREVNMVELVGSLRNELMRIRNWDEHHTGSTEDMDELRSKDQLEAQKEALQEELVSFKQRLADTYRALEAIGQDETEAKKAAAALEEKLRGIQEELRSNVAKRDLAEEELKDEKQLNEGNRAHIKQLSDLLQSAGDTINSLQHSIIEQRAACGLLQRERESMAHHLEELSRNHNRLAEKIRVMESDIHEKTRKLTEVNNELKQHVNTTKRLQGKISTAMGSLHRVRTHKEKVIQEKKYLLSEQKKRDKRIKQYEEKVRSDELEIKQLNIKNDTLQSKFVKADFVIDDLTQNMTLLSHVKKRIDEEYKKLRVGQEKLKNTISDLTKQKQKCQNEQAVLALQAEIKDEELALKGSEIGRCKKEIEHLNTKLRSQSHLYEKLLFQRNAIAKNLHEHEGRLVITDSDLKIATSCIEQLKENLISQENKIQNLNTVLNKAAMQREELSNKVNRLKDRENKLTVELKAMKSNESKYISEIKDLEEEKDMMSRRLKEMKYDRDIIGTQLVRKNDEIRLLKTANDDFRKESFRGHEQYARRLDDIRLLRAEILDLRRHRDFVSSKPGMMMDLKRELYNLHRDFTAERLRRVALEEEGANVINVHHWRKLEAEDPAQLELIQKVDALQRQLIKVREEKWLREEQLREGDRLVSTLSSAIAKMPPRENYRATVAKQERCIKALIAEARVSKCESSLCNREASEATIQMDKFKRMFYSAKKLLESNGIVFRMDQEDC